MTLSVHVSRALAAIHVPCALAAVRPFSRPFPRPFSAHLYRCQAARDHQPRRGNQRSREKIQHLADAQGNHGDGEKDGQRGLVALEILLAVHLCGMRGRRARGETGAL